VPVHVREIRDGTALATNPEDLSRIGSPMTGKDREAFETECDLAERFMLTFIEQFPEAADTVEGIARWWFEANSHPVAPDVLDATLARLAVLGIMQARVLPSGATLWSAVPPLDDASLKHDSQ
jgi:hypothetical protein